MQATEIQWTEKSWNPVRGCTRVSEGCTRCYAERQAARYSGPGLPFEGFAVNTPAGPRWTGKVELITDKLGEPLRMRKPARIFVNSMSDLFHEALSDRAIMAIFAVMAGSPQHVFQVLTKRPERMRQLLGWIGGDGVGSALSRKEAFRQAIEHYGMPLPGWLEVTLPSWPLPNVWLGVSCEDQATADERIPLLLQCPAAVRWVSAEPLLGPIDFTEIMEVRSGLKVMLSTVPQVEVGESMQMRTKINALAGYNDNGRHTQLDWVVVGGESGPGARPMHPDWARLLQNQCETAGVPFFFKQWGNWIQLCPSDGRATHVLALAGKCSPRLGRPITECLQGGGVFVGQLGKRDAGRMLDGRTWDEMTRSSGLASAGGDGGSLNVAC